MTLKEGWKYTIETKNWHYYRNMLSLCGKFGILSYNYLETGNDTSPENCAACMSRVPTKEQKLEIKLELLRTRWRRWLGNKTRVDKPHWASLLNSNYVGWVQRVRKKQDLKYAQIFVTISRKCLKDIYLEAIDNSDISDLQALDEIYCSENLL